ncbi:MAG: beta-ketoacyl-[acyl-carrier-protein] synthase family protein [Myxococcota bacterium]|nr:beta-ketoacyl-[acyl-carrier-protein] synthase family protein [Myxococcota bacterium]
MNEVWVTGLGIRSAAGQSINAFGNALLHNRFCGVNAQSELDVTFVARVSEPEIGFEDVFPDDRKCTLGFAAALDALEQSKLNNFNQMRSIIFVGTGLSSITPNEFEVDIYPHLLDGKLSRQTMANDLRSDLPSPNRHLPNRFATVLAEKIGHKGLIGTNFSACAAAAQAMAEGFFTLSRGEADVALVGGHDSMDHPMGLLSFLVLGALSPAYCRPFDVRRNGFMLGEGAAMFVLEREDHARARGVSPLAKISGAGTSIDANNATAPHEEGMGAALAMKRALKVAGLRAGEIGYVNAHGTGTPLGDVAESLAIQRVLGSDVPVSSIKGAIGHTIAAAGALEGAACIWALQNNILPGTVGLNQIDEKCPVNALKDPLHQKVEHIISNSFGFGGQNASLIFSRVEL